MQYIALVLRLTIVLIGIYMIFTNPAGTPQCLSGVAFILIGASLCLNRIMSVKGTPCLIKCFNKK